MSTKKKVSELGNAGSFGGSELLLVVQDGETRQTLLGAVAEWVLKHVGNPTADAHAANKLYVDTIASALRGPIRTPVGSIEELKAIPVQERIDRQLCHVEGVAIYAWDAQSTLPADGVRVIRPNGDPVYGRWIYVANPSPTHNALAGLQGGIENERYHLTAAQHASFPEGASGENKLVLDNDPRLVGGGGGGGGGAGFTRVPATSDVTLEGTDNFLVAVTALPTGGMIIKLPAEPNVGHLVVVVDEARVASSSVNLVKIEADGGHFVEGHAAIVMHSNGMSITLQHDGASNWRVVHTTGVWGIDPRTISGLVTWHAMDRGATTNNSSLATGGRVISGLLDLSGNEKHLLHSTGARTYLPTPQGFCYYSTGSSSSYLRSTTSGADQPNFVSYVSGAFTILAVAFLNATNNGDRAIAASNYGVSSGWYLGQENADFAIRLHAPGTGAYVQGALFTPLRSSMPFLVSVRLWEGFGLMRVNGLDVTTSNKTDVPFSTVTSQQFYIGAANRDGVGGQYWSGGVYEVMTFDGQITATQLVALEEYLRRKYKL